MGILRRTHRLLCLLIILFSAGVFQADPQRSKRQAANQPWNFLRNLYRQRMLNQQRLRNTRLVGPRRGPLLTNNEGQPGLSNQPLFNNWMFANPPANSLMNNRFLNNFGENQGPFFMPWRNLRLLNQGPLLIPGPGQRGAVQNTPPQDPTDAPEFINGVLVTELPEPPDPTDPPEIPPAQPAPFPPNSPFSNFFWQGYRNPSMPMAYDPADPTDPPEPPEPTEPPEFPPAAVFPPSTISAPSLAPLTTPPIPVPQAQPPPPLFQGNMSPQIQMNQQAAPRGAGSSANQSIGTGIQPTVQQVGPLTSKPATTPLSLIVIAANSLVKTPQGPVVQSIATPGVEVTVPPNSDTAAPSGVNFMYAPRRGYNPTWTIGTNLAPWRQTMWNRLLYNF